MTQIKADFLLFDLDGTLVNSTPSVEQTWHKVVAIHNEKHPGSKIDPEVFLQSSHGSRTLETFRRFFPYRDASPEAISAFEAAIVTEFGHLAIEVKGALKLLKQLNDLGNNSWAIVTSGTRDFAYGWFSKLFAPAIDQPLVFITANDVTEGKPDPEGYRTAAERLHKINRLTRESSAVVFEDAPTGIRAGVAAGFQVVGIATTFSPDVLLDAGASYVIDDMSKVTIDSSTPAGVEFTLQDLRK